jgi:hypothetical protein
MHAHFDNVAQHKYIYNEREASSDFYIVTKGRVKLLTAVEVAAKRGEIMNANNKKASASAVRRKPADSTDQLRADLKFTQQAILDLEVVSPMGM